MERGECVEDGLLGGEHGRNRPVFGEQAERLEVALDGDDPERVFGVEGFDDGGDDHRKDITHGSRGGAGRWRRPVLAGDFALAGVEVLGEDELLADGEAGGGGGGLAEGDLDRLAGGGCPWQLAIEHLDVRLVARERLELAEGRLLAGRFAFLADGEAGRAEVTRGGGGEPADALVDPLADGFAECGALLGAQGNKAELGTVARALAQLVADGEGEAEVGHGARIDRAGGEE